MNLEKLRNSPHYYSNTGKEPANEESPEYQWYRAHKYLIEENTTLDIEENSRTPWRFNFVVTAYFTSSKEVTREQNTFYYAWLNGKEESIPIRRNNIVGKKGAKWLKEKGVLNNE